MRDKRGRFLLPIDKDAILDVHKLSIGAFYPLKGFMNKKDFISVIRRMHLADGHIWPIPIVLPVPEEKVKPLRGARSVTLVDRRLRPIADMKVESLYRQDKKLRCVKVYGTSDVRHPGVHAVLNQPQYLIGGIIQKTYPTLKAYINKIELTPSETKRIFKKRRWKTVAAFHTRNIPHTAHEYLQKCALEITDGLLIHPIIGVKKSGDFTDEIIIAAYKAFVGNCIPKNRVVFTPFSRRSEYAGPREAILHAIERKNYGCTHMIIGRDHAGVHDFYDKYASHRIFDDLEDIGITPLRFNGPFYCRRCGKIATIKTCPHDPVFHMQVSGTRIREELNMGRSPRKEFLNQKISCVVKSMLKKEKIFH